MSVVLARMLPPETFGQFAWISAALTSLMIPLSFTSGQLLIADCGKTDGLFERVMGLTLLIVLVKALMLGIVVSCAAFVYGDTQMAVVAALVGLPLIYSDWVATIRLDLESKGDFRPNFVAQAFQIAFHASASITLVWFGFGIYGLAAGGLASTIPQIIVYYRASTRNIFAFSIAPREIALQLLPGFWLWLNQTSEGLLSRIDKLFLGRFGSDTELGYYNRAFNFAPFSQMALNSLMANATVVGLARAPSADHQSKLFFKTSAIVALGAILNWALWYWFSDPLVVWIFGTQWVGAIPSFEAFAWLSLAYGLLYMPTTMLLARGKFRALALCKSIGLVLLCAALGIIGLAGTVSSVSVAYCFLGVLVLTGLAISAVVYYTSPPSES